ncbi:MAG TPA: phospholipase C, phosphocholine-specific [Terriglobales bacterium]|jgi:phospholipase C|nr:phospholipase C, phosphocholine-specific [Terriglobales bacterium]
MSIDRRKFLQLTGAAGFSLATLKTNIAKALAIPASNRTGTIQDVEHIIILTQENRPFDHHFGTIFGVRGFNDPRAVKINLPLRDGGSTQVSVFLQPAGPANEAAGFSVPPNFGNLGGPVNGVDVIPPFRLNPNSVTPVLKSLGGLYMPGTGHDWNGTHASWNNGQYDQWAVQRGPMAMSYMTRDDVPYHCALADAFTVGDAYFCSVMGPTNPNRMYMWSGCIGNLSNLGPAGADGHGAGPMTYNGLSINDAYWTFPTFPEVLQAAGITWKIYQDLAGGPGAPFFGDGEGFGNAFTGNFADNTVLYFNQYAAATPGAPLFEGAATGTDVLSIIPPSGAPEEAWLAWAEHLFDDFRNDVQSGKLPQVSWIAAPAGYTEHSDWPIDYGAWYISQIFNILVSNPDVFSKTVFIVNYDEGDGSFDHIVSPTPPPGPGFGASTVSIENEIVTANGEPAGFLTGPIGLSTRVPLLAISPWSKGGFVDSQVFDASSLIQFIEKRFGVFEPNISPWRRSVVGDLTSIFNFGNPNQGHVKLPSTDSFLPSVDELGGGSVPDLIPAIDTVIIGIPQQEKGIRPARALPYELNVGATVNPGNSTIALKFINTGGATVVFQVRSGDPEDPVRTYSVEPGKQLQDVWSITSSYDLSVYGPNGFLRSFKGSIGPHAAILDVVSTYGTQGRGSIAWTVTNLANAQAEVNVLDAYTGKSVSQVLPLHHTFEGKLELDRFGGWYDLIVKVPGDATFKYQLAGHVETGNESISDPALGGLINLRG